MRLATLSWPFPFLVRLGWATVRTPNPDPRQAVGRAFLLRGQGIVFSRGFGRICAELRRAGWWAEDLRCVGHSWLWRHLSAEHRAGRLHGPVVLVGHSCGGRSAVETARWLEPLGISVRLLVCVDVAFPSPVPANVEQAVHLYRTQRRLYPASALCAVPGSRTVIENIDLDAAASPLHERWLHHLNITSRPAVRDWILGAFLERRMGLRTMQWSETAEIDPNVMEERNVFARLYYLVRNGPFWGTDHVATLCVESAD